MLKILTPPIVILSAVTAILFLAWRFIDPIVVVRYRLTLYVEAGNRVIEGASVQEETGHSNWIWQIAGPWTGSFKGEAVAVDLGARGVLVATLTPDASRLSSTANGGLVGGALAEWPSPDGGLIANWNWERNIRSDVVEIPLERLPMLVCFHDRADRRSLERVFPDDLAKALGPDVRLIRATIQAVPRGWWPFSVLPFSQPQWLFGAPVTDGLEKYLPWLDQMGDHASVLGEHKSEIGLPPEYQLGKVDFIWNMH